ncbi:hypothetical protein AVEN_197514-1 [Araneus ventricosus]|uniref:Uncharacterized protein n=1 Tax=Araneus ventricosus TaxID=182803 RepID=A0A4Y2BRL2_ARAVE|nr:hypothetical protein AVEN_197514-1 [Araneus ventricosus]
MARSEELRLKRHDLLSALHDYKRGIYTDAASFYNTEKGKTTQLKTRIKRKSYTLKRKVCKPILVVRSKPDPLDKIQPSDPADMRIDHEYKPAYSEKKSPWQIRINLKAPALNNDHYGVSHRAAAAIASSMLQDWFSN